ncbi:MAG: DHHW family protein [Oscillospiraceae bacterium]
MWKKAKDSLLFLIIGGIILIVFVVGLVLPDRDFSENENKYLAKMPDISFKTLVNGKFATDYETYVADQFLFRDEWIAAKSIAEFSLLKTENNGVAYGSDGYIFSKFSSFDPKIAEANLNAIDTFAYNTTCEVSMVIVPSSYYVLSDKVPFGLPTVDEGFYIDEFYNYLKNSVTNADAKDSLIENSDKYIYYRTDHHWTTYGAWLAYNQFAKSNGIVPVNYDALKPVSVDGFLGTGYSKCKAFNAHSDVITYFPELDCLSLTTNGEKHNTLYNLDRFAKRDKYSAFLFGNSSMIEIETKYSGTKRDSLLIIRDSYADSLVPYLTENYNKIVLVDPRYYNLSYSELSKQNFTDVLIVFGFENLVGEKSIVKLGT